MNRHSFRPQLETLDERALPSRSFLEAPLVPEIDGTQQVFLREIVQLGQAVGRRADLFLKAGDSNTALPTFLTELGSPGCDPVRLGDHASLADTIDYFTRTSLADGSNSFTRPQGYTSYGGWTVDQLLSTVGPELDRTGAGVVLIQIGTNDLLQGQPEVFRSKLTQLVSEALVRGVVPVLSTIPYNFALSGSVLNLVPIYNQVIADVADATGVPLINVWLGLSSLPGFGVPEDGTHPLGHPTRGSADFSPEGLRHGANLRNLLTLQTLAELRDEVLDPRQPWLPAGDGTGLLALGSAAGAAPMVRIVDTATGRELIAFRPFSPLLRSGVHVTLGDVTGDGTVDIIVAPASGSTHVKVFDGVSGAEVRSFFAFAGALPGGVSVASADLTGDGWAEIIVGAGAGGGPVVRIFDGATGTELRSFFAFPAEFTGGVSVATGDLNGDARPDVIVRGGPAVAAYDGVTHGELFRRGVSWPGFASDAGLAVGDLDGDGLADVAVGLGPFVAVYRGRDGQLLLLLPTLPAGVDGRTGLAITNGRLFALASLIVTVPSAVVGVSRTLTPTGVPLSFLWQFDATGGVASIAVVSDGMMGSV